MRQREGQGIDGSFKSGDGAGGRARESGTQNTAGRAFQITPGQRASTKERKPRASPRTGGRVRRRALRWSAGDAPHGGL